MTPVKGYIWNYLMALFFLFYAEMCLLFLLMVYLFRTSWAMVDLMRELYTTKLNAYTLLTRRNFKRMLTKALKVHNIVERCGVSVSKILRYITCFCILSWPIYTIDDNQSRGPGLTFQVEHVFYLISRFWKLCFCDCD